jgi:hypothetical protein
VVLIDNNRLKSPFSYRYFSKGVFRGFSVNFPCLQVAVTRSVRNVDTHFVPLSDATNDAMKCVVLVF